MTRRWSLLAFASGCLAIPGAVAVWGGEVADQMGFELGRQVASVIGPAQAAPALSDPAYLEPLHLAEAEVGQRIDVAGEVSAERAPAVRSSAAVGGSRRPRATPSRAVSGVFVGAETVLALANAGVRPTGVPVAATEDRPGGIALRGVSALGLGALDGDVITVVNGSPAGSVGSVVGAVLMARSRGAVHVTAQAWRGATPYSIRVEMPYPSARSERLASRGTDSNAN